jgi:hypothetical protein
MKKPQFKQFAIATLLMGGLLASCEKNQDELPEPDAQDSFEVVALQQADESEWVSEEVINVAEEVYAAEEIAASGKLTAKSGFIPECVTITTVQTDTSVEKTIDFGEGCETPNGNFISGAVILSYSKDMEQATKTLSLSLSEFTFNGIAVEGGAQILRMRSNANGNPQSDISSAFNGTWPDGETASWEGNRTREWIEGYGSGFWGDNVFLITGSQTFISRAGNTYNRTVLEALRRELSCRFIVSGVLQINRNDLSASLDFGDGNCDGFGELTYPDGTTETVPLRRFRP